MIKKITALLLSVAILLGCAYFIAGAEESDSICNALNALLIGVQYPTEESNPSQWSDSTVRDTIYRKLIWDDFLNSEESYLHKAELNPLPSENRYLHFSLAHIQTLTQSVFGRSFPSQVSSEHIFTSGEELIIARTTDEMTVLSVQDFIERNGNIVALGIAVQEFRTYSEFLGCFEATFAPSTESVYGYTLISLKPVEDQTTDSLQITASSELRSIGDVSHVATNAIDGDLDTSWAEAVPGNGEGQWLQLSSTDEKKLHICAIGFAFADDNTSNRPCKILLELADGYRQEIEFHAQSDVVVLQQPIFSEWVKITIADTIGEDPYDITSIHEIRLHGLGAYFPEHEPIVTEEPTQETTAEPTEEIVTTEEVVTTEELTAALQEDAVSTADSSINIWLWVILIGIIVACMVCFIVLILILKKKGSL